MCLRSSAVLPTFSEGFKREHILPQCRFRRLLVTSEASGRLCDGEAKVLHCHVFSGSGSGGQVPIGMSIYIYITCMKFKMYIYI